MTVAALSDRQPLLDGQGDELGPIATFGAQVFIFFAVIFSFSVTGFEVFPGVTPLALLAGTFGVVLLAPRAVLMRTPISIVALMMIGWMLASVTWTDSAGGSAFAIQRDVPILVGMVIAVGMISLKDLVAALLWAIRVSAIFTLVIIAIFPDTRIHIDPAGVAPDLDGWHGYFPHKNIMTPFFIFGILTILTFDRTKLIRWVTLAIIGVLIVGSDSVTGLVSAVFACCVWVWIQLYRQLDLRNSSIFLISSLSVGLFGVLGVAASLATLTSASGRDLTFTGRTFIWSAAWEAVLERPLVGWGIGGILSSVPTSPKTAEVWRAIGFQVPHAHNGLLDLALQLGFVGVAIFVMLFLATMAGGLSIVRDRPEVAAWIVSTMVVQLFISISENVFIGNGWLPTLVMFRILLLRTKGMELSTGSSLADRLRSPAPGRV